MATEWRKGVFPCSEGLDRFIAPFTPQAIPPSQSERGERTALPEATRAVERAAERERERDKEKKWENIEERKRQSQVWRRENTGRRSKRAWEGRKCYPEKLSSPLVLLHHPACVFLHPCDFLHGPLALWPLCRLPFLSPALSLCSRLTR